MSFLISPLTVTCVRPVLPRFGNQVQEDGDNPPNPPSTPHGSGDGKRNIAASKSNPPLAPTKKVVKQTPKEQRIETLGQTLESIIDSNLQLTALATQLSTNEKTPFTDISSRGILIHMANFLDDIQQFVAREKATNPWIVKGKTPTDPFLVHPPEEHDFTNPLDKMTFKNWQRAQLAQWYDSLCREIVGPVRSSDAVLALFAHFLEHIPLHPMDERYRHEANNARHHRLYSFELEQVPIIGQGQTANFHLFVKILKSPEYYLNRYKRVQKQIEKGQQQRLLNRKASENVSNNYLIANIISRYQARFEKTLGHPVDIFQIAAVRSAELNYMNMVQREILRQNTNHSRNVEFHIENQTKWVNASACMEAIHVPRESEHILNQLTDSNPVVAWHALQELWDECLKPQSLSALQELDLHVILKYPPVQLAKPVPSTVKLTHPYTPSEVINDSNDT